MSGLDEQPGGRSNLKITWSIECPKVKDGDEEYEVDELCVTHDVLLISREAGLSRGLTISVAL